MGLHPSGGGFCLTVWQQINDPVRIQIHQHRAERSATQKWSGKGNDVAIAPSPKNRAGYFRSTRLKPFVSPVSPDAVSLRANPGYEFAGGRWDEARPDFLLDPILLWIAIRYDDCASP
jgi:hypothetical protein